MTVFRFRCTSIFNGIFSITMTENSLKVFAREREVPPSASSCSQRCWTHFAAELWDTEALFGSQRVSRNRLAAVSRSLELGGGGTAPARQERVWPSRVFKGVCIASTPTLKPRASSPSFEYLPHLIHRGRSWDGTRRTVSCFASLAFGIKAATLLSSKGIREGGWRGEGARRRRFLAYISSGAALRYTVSSFELIGETVWFPPLLLDQSSHCCLHS